MKLSCVQTGRMDFMFVFKLPTSSPNQAMATTKSTQQSELQHRRLGQSLRLLSNLSNGITLDNKPDHFCIPCVQAKSHRSFFANSESHSTHIGYLVHSDVCYIGVPTIVDDFTMFVLFIDDFSRYTSVYLLRSKTDATSAFYHFEKKLTNMTGKHITILRSDGGGEYFSSAVKDYCNEFGISQQSSTPFTPQHNGRAERPNRTVVEGASAMLLDSKLSWEYWGYAVQTFVYLKNRSTQKNLPIYSL
jgi:Integrase core domain